MTRSDMNEYWQEPPFIIHTDPEAFEKSLSKQRRMVTSVSSKYLINNTQRANTVHTIGASMEQSRIGAQSVNEDAKNKLNNFNQY